MFYVLYCTDIYEITVLLLRTLRFLEIRTCETTDELGWVICPRFIPGPIYVISAYEVIGFV